MTIVDIHALFTTKPPRFGPMFKTPHITRKLCRNCGNCGWPMLNGYCDRETCR